MRLLEVRICFSSPIHIVFDRLQAEQPNLWPGHYPPACCLAAIDVHCSSIKVNGLAQLKLGMAGPVNTGPMVQ